MKVLLGSRVFGANIGRMCKRRRRISMALSRGLYAEREKSPGIDESEPRHVPGRGTGGHGGTPNG